MIPKVYLFPRRLAIFFIKIYQKTLSFDHSFWGKLVKPHGQCRFYPTCSNYSISALEQYGLFKGLLLSIKRIIHCHPWSRGGYDPIK
ncbi:MAG TPA: membrane protein insertion efficiency factor YidD [Patescibacteria group bacterium]|nr:membrane protein insertion efficiency factor YidD [Patescibacteria group bacterium]